MNALPRGAIVRLDDRSRWLDDSTLVGGAPARLFRFGAGVRELLEGGLEVTDGNRAALAATLVRAGAAHLDLSTVQGIERSEVTVVVPVHGRAAPLTRLLDALPSGCAEVIVVDDASPDPVALHAAIAGREHHRLIRLATNQGPAAARNAGLAQVRTRFVLFVDSDVVVGGAALDHLLRHFADPALAVVAPRVCALPSAPSWLGRYEEEASALDMGTRSAVVQPRTPVGWLPSACWLARVETLGAGFDPQLRVAEDVDLIWRLVAAGGSVRYAAEVPVHHEHRVQWGAWLERRFRYGTGATPLAQRHGATVAPAVLTPWTATLLLAVAAQRRWSLPVAVLACATGAIQLWRRLPEPQPLARARQAGALTARGAATALEQGVSLTVRHAWPVAVLGAALGPRGRRVALAALLADAVLARRRRTTSLDPARHLLARRADDLAYGAGVWWSAWQGRSVRALLPDLVLPTRARAPGGPAARSSLRPEGRAGRRSRPPATGRTPPAPTPG
ncbi:mycofactocin biosynthesis glycosyltransferase MftF [Nocardioides sp. Bht2]|uniref:mycofactocin biosynthesis glycosyltransferase MftF n=1 Tax=Nocardioides sp. Bht2 TaxID=3392297 RepID=UPI0039B6BA73